jgi:hypothetical protein
MDILNWIYLVKNKFTRTTIESPATDLVVLGADVGFQKRGDKYQNYVMTAADFGLSLGINPQFTRTTDGTIVTGVTTATKSTSLLIPANTVAVGDSIFVRTRCRKTGTAGTTAQYVSVNTLDNVGGSGIAIAALAANAAFAQLSRTLVVKSSTSTEVFPYNTGGFDDDSVSTTVASTYNINWTVDQYFIFYTQNVSVADSSVVSYYEVTVNKG